MQDIEILKNNCKEYSRSPSGVSILRHADGKSDYKKIALILGIHPTTVSGQLKKAHKLHLVQKNKDGFYKKIAGILGYMPKGNIKSNSTKKKTIKDILSVTIKSKQIKTPAGTVVPSKLTRDSVKKAQAYLSLYLVENTLRELIRKVISGNNNWWKNNIPAGIQTNVVDTMAKTPYHAIQRKDELEYTHLGELAEIIAYKKNWNDFLPHLKEKDKARFSATISKAIPSRNAIGHCITLKSDDLKVIEIRFKDILEMIS